ncbi:MAG: glutamate-1-semialdehyde 2,1-aminomutase [Oscillospiraceae bacterium]|jgi:glutamate-1-semialdehyde 2,1-aminomutase|nr:glutamate-1-semialdehyde 2,1-aminomutase [Oscillospiraceae bacterium]
MSESESLFQRAQQVIPGGVNSPVRAFRAVGGTPPFIRRGAGARLWDEDGREYLDFVGSWGPMILGHGHPAVLAAVEEALRDGLSFGAPTRREVLAAETICGMVPGLEQIRMVNSGTEAVMSALRLARGASGRSRIIKFAGCYHGHSDSMLVKAGSGALTAGSPDSLGVPPEAAKDTLVAEYNDLSSAEALFARFPGEIACVIVEPAAANMGLIPPEPGFLQGLRELCSCHGALLIFDEVITGFRLAPGGAQEYYGVEADLVTYGKIIGGGMPVGAYGGRRELMEQVAPCGGVYQAGTLSGNPIAMAAGLAQLSLLEPALYQRLEELGRRLEEGLLEIVRRRSLGVTIHRAGSLACVFFREGPVRSYRDALRSDVKAFAGWFRRMLEQGIYLAPSQFEAIFLSGAHSEKDVDRFLEAADRAFQG